MAEETERPYPIRSLHEFLSELDKEWDKFRTGSLIGMATSGVLLIFIVLRFLHLAIRQKDILVFLFLILVVIFLLYSMYSLYAQYSFFKKWERRVGLLIHLEAVSYTHLTLPTKA